MIICCGEALIDMLPRETKAGETAFAPYAGGAVFNTAIALGRLGAPAGFFSGLSSDFFGDQLRDTLTASMVDFSGAVKADRPTTLAFVRLVDGQASYAFYDENTAGRMLTPADLPVLPVAEALFFGGISLVGEPSGAAYEALMAREAPNCVTMIDPNIRTSFIADEASYRDRITRMIGMADMVKVSDEDLIWLMGAGAPEDLAQKMLTQGPEVVFITKGSDGAVAVTASGVTRVASTPVTVVDTVGAGDTFNAGVLAALHRRGKLTKAGVATLDSSDLEAALSLGATAAAVTVSRAGANPPWLAELED